MLSSKDDAFSAVTGPTPAYGLSLVALDSSDHKYVVACQTNLFLKTTNAMPVVNYAQALVDCLYTENSSSILCFESHKAKQHKIGL